MELSSFSWNWSGQGTDLLDKQKGICQNLGKQNMISRFHIRDKERSGNHAAFPGSVQVSWEEKHLTRLKPGL